MARCWATCALAVVALGGCRGSEGQTGNPGPQGPSGPTGPAGPTGLPGRDGVAGQDGLEGGTPTLLGNVLAQAIQYADGDSVRLISQYAIVAPATGSLLVRVYVHGVVAKRDDATSCQVEVSLRRDQDVLPLASQALGIVDAPRAGRLEVSVGGTLATNLQVAAGQRVIFHVELERADPACAPAGGGGPTQIARIFAQLEAQFYRVTLATQ